MGTATSDARTMCYESAPAAWQVGSDNRCRDTTRFAMTEGALRRPATVPRQLILTTCGPAIYFSQYDSTCELYHETIAIPFQITAIEQR